MYEIENKLGLFEFNHICYVDEVLYNFHICIVRYKITRRVLE